MTTLEPATAPQPIVREATSPDWRAGLLLAWIIPIVPLLLVATAAFSMTRRRTVADIFLFAHDLPVIVLTAGLMMAMRFAPLAKLRWGDVVLRLLNARAPLVAASLAVGSAGIAMAGWPLVLSRYGLSMDEFMASFDAAIFRRGALVAPIADAWRPYAFALQPQFILPVPGHAYWVSAYLPGNAAIHALFAALGAPLLVNALWAVLAVVSVFAVARRLWPERPDAAAVAAVLLASSSQFLLTGMTPYAMPAHLALNMAWLWLFLRGDRRGDAGALAVGFIACGLHQVVFHPLFAGPFILGLWLSRRWTRAAVYTAVYAAIGLFWLLYWQLILPPATTVAVAGGSGLGYFLAQGSQLLAKIDPSAIGLMAENLLRFIAWQNPLMAALAVGAGAAAVRHNPTLRALIVGIALTLLMVGLLMPLQGHGWGYRYLHAFLGAVALVGAYGWVRLTDRLALTERRGAGAAFALAAGFSLLCLLPIRAVQAHAMTAPYAAAAKAIDALDAEVVLIDPSGLLQGPDLVRNDPWLGPGPKRMDLGVMTDEQVTTVCARHRVALFGQDEGLAVGMDSDPSPPDARMQQLLALLARLDCAR